MATVDLAQLPPPQIIEVLDFEVILADVKAVMIAAFPDEQQASVAAALKLESEPDHTGAGDCLPGINAAPANQ